jgi:hypothetical protein|tara:strand:+ start:271 stop:894 length:624 start_codon:yes stop_codon:yes gene_type:complete
MAVVVRKPTVITFIDIPKTASTSIASWLVEHAGGFQFLKRHTTCRKMQNVYKDVGHTFCVIRNPWDRMVSYYHHHIFKLTRNIQEVTDHAGEHPRHKDKDYQIDHCEMVLNHLSKGFKFFIQNFDQWGWSSWSKQQQHWTEGVDQILRYESLDHDFVSIQRMIGCAIPLPKINVGSHRDYKTYYDQETIDIVAKHFATDIALFNYNY